jgi:protein-tyrosine kinase
MTMNEKPRVASGSLIERAAAAYGFDGFLPAPALPVQASDPEPPLSWPIRQVPPATAALERPIAVIDRDRLAERGLIVPGSPPSVLSEEFRIVKRQILLSALGSSTTAGVARGRLVLVTSGQPDEGKTFCAVNLALSMASETDLEVLLVDADVAKPEILEIMGVEAERGLMDALADPSIDVESFVVATDVPNLSMLSAGGQRNDDTELLASDRTRTLVDGLLARNPRRIVIFDSAPALAASPASVLALNVGQVLIVVRADRTSEGELRETVALVDGCPEIRLMLNAVTFGGSNRKFGSYYGVTG